MLDIVACIKMQSLKETGKSVFLLKLIKKFIVVEKQNWASVEM